MKVILCFGLLALCMGSTLNTRPVTPRGSLPVTGGPQFIGPNGKPYDPKSWHHFEFYAPGLINIQNITLDAPMLVHSLALLSFQVSEGKCAGQLGLYSKDLALLQAVKLGSTIANFHVGVLPRSMHLKKGEYYMGILTTSDWCGEILSDFGGYYVNISQRYQTLPKKLDLKNYKFFNQFGCRGAFLQT
eukprot:NODE_1859_length_712_cov_57.471795_g1809_i0.p1 GENE.NODE_1859_length_712_cov_57.471795_g1809_i0~~NODE_1859_length_712_cov_57.471795_g1809_i0.p1  ORF type:complete len:188 (+),score=20.69 NODE_1859_length_712_cov_57.471795_g1809_i0:63-626(+)